MTNLNKEELKRAVTQALTSLKGSGTIVEVMNEMSKTGV